MNRCVLSSMCLVAIAAFVPPAIGADDGRYDDYGKRNMNGSTREERGVNAYNEAFQARTDAKRNAGNERGAVRDEVNESRKAERYYRQNSSSGAGIAK